MSLLFYLEILEKSMPKICKQNWMSYNQKLRKKNIEPKKLLILYNLQCLKKILIIWKKENTNLD